MRDKHITQEELDRILIENEGNIFSTVDMQDYYEVADDLDLTYSNVCRCIKTLCEQGYISEEIVEGYGDKYLVLEDKGVDFDVYWLPKVKELNSDEKVVFIYLLDRFEGSGSFIVRK